MDSVSSERNHMEVRCSWLMTFLSDLEILLFEEFEVLLVSSKPTALFSGQTIMRIFNTEQRFYKTVMVIVLIPFI